MSDEQPTNTSSDASVLETLKKMTNNPSDRKHLVAVLTRNKPKNWSRKTCAPYYRETYAKQFRDNVLEPMIKSGQSMVLYYADHPGLKPETLYLKLSQARMYLFDFLDPDRRYELFWQAIVVTKKRGVGLQIQIVPELIGEIRGHSVGETAFKAKPMFEDQVVWRDKLEVFLDQAAVGQQFMQEGLALSPEEIQEYEMNWSSLTNIVYRITPEKIIITKIA